MNIKRQVIENLQQKFNRELSALRYEEIKNKNVINKLVEKQQIIKRTKAELTVILRSIGKQTSGD